MWWTGWTQTTSSSSAMRSPCARGEAACTARVTCDLQRPPGECAHARGECSKLVVKTRSDRAPRGLRRRVDSLVVCHPWPRPGERARSREARRWSQCRYAVYDPLNSNCCVLAARSAIVRRTCGRLVPRQEGAEAIGVYASSPAPPLPSRGQLPHIRCSLRAGQE